MQGFENNIPRPNYFKFKLRWAQTHIWAYRLLTHLIPRDTILVILIYSQCGYDNLIKMQEERFHFTILTSISKFHTQWLKYFILFIRKFRFLRLHPILLLLLLSFCYVLFWKCQRKCKKKISMDRENKT